MEHQTMVKEYNLNLIRRFLRQTEQATKPQIAAGTGLSVVTVNALVKILVEQGEVLLHRQMESEGGRPAQSYVYNGDFHLGLAVFMHEEQGEDRVYYRVVNLRGEVRYKLEQRIENPGQDCFDREILHILEAYPDIRGIVMGVPGVEVHGKMLIMDYPGLKDMDLAGHIQTLTGLPVRIENDVNVALYGYATRPEYASLTGVAAIYFPEKYEPGSAFFLGGRLYRGKNGLAGEIKFLPFDEMEKEHRIANTVLALACTWNPERLVLYGSYEESTILGIIEGLFSGHVEKEMLPQMEISQSLNQDSEDGVVRMAADWLIDMQEGGLR